MRTLCLIPARGGSKRIPQKNIKDFLGFPIISYAIRSALASNLFEEVMVSTDSPEIGQVAKKYGANVPFFRGESASGDFATTAEVIFEVLQEYGKQGRFFDYVCCIYPTAVFATQSVLVDSFSAFVKSQADALLPVVRFGFPIQRAVKITQGKISLFNPEFMNTRSQDLEPAYHDCGQFYWIKCDSFMVQKSLYMKETIAFEIDEMRAQDIDTLTDWENAEFKYKLLEEKAK